MRIREWMLVAIGVASMTVLADDPPKFQAFRITPDHQLDFYPANARLPVPDRYAIQGGRMVIAGTPLRSRHSPSGRGELENDFTKQNIAQVKDRMDHFREKHVESYTRAFQHGMDWSAQFTQQIDLRARTLVGYYANFYYHDYYGAYFPQGFFGGYFFPTYPRDNVGSYFVYPTVHWLYYPKADDQLYSDFYEGDYKGYEVKPFAYPGAYFPTDTLVDLMIEQSNYTAAKEELFRTALTQATDLLRMAISTGLDAELTYAPGDIVVTSYQNLQDTGYQVVGYVDRDDLHVSFEAFLDLTNPNDGTMVFVPLSDRPTTLDLTRLGQINDKIRSLGGDPLQAILEGN